jgi:hypothetical protein
MRATRSSLSITAALLALALPLGACGLNANDPRSTETIVQAEDPPPPVSGGTLVVSRDGEYAIASDPDRDAVHVITLADGTVRTVALTANDEPGRVIEGAEGVVHVVLRGGDAFASITLATLETTRTSTCRAPRGIAWDGSRIHVACATGEVWSFDAPATSPARTLLVARDLRDLVVVNGHLFATRFRASDVIAIADDGTASPLATLISYAYTDTTTHNEETFTPMVAWRTVATSSGRLIVLHERGRVGPGFPPRVVRRYYGGESPQWTPPCGRNTAYHATVDLVGADGSMERAGPILADMALPVDVAVHADRVAIVSASELDAFRNGGPQLLVTSLGAIADATNCVSAEDDPRFAGQPVAVAFAPDGSLLVQTREPAELHVMPADGGDRSITLATGSRRDSGHELFHSDSGLGIACASCHPEGGDDGHVWTFRGLGTRRTQMLRGGIAGSAPFHWAGDVPSFTELTHVTFEDRMGGSTLRVDHGPVLAHFLDGIAAVPAPPASDPAAVDRGRALFESSDTGCAQCHVGSRLSNDQTVDVGTGTAFQVPTLLELGARLPLGHDGCMTDLTMRFASGRCAGTEGMHGRLAGLSPDQVDDMIAYMRTL